MNKIIFLFCAIFLYANTIDDFKTACENGNKDVCKTLGDIYKNGYSLKFDQSKIEPLENKIIELHKLQCNNNDAHSCYEVGKSIMFNSEIKNNETEAKKFFKKSADLYARQCNDNNATGCSHLAIAYEYGGGVVENKNKSLELRDKALRLYEADCDNGDDSSCSMVARKYEDIDKIKANDFVLKEINIVKNKCDNNLSSACRRLGWLFKNIQDTKNSEFYYLKARELNKINCNNGKANDCYVLYLTEKDENNKTNFLFLAKPLLEADCKKNSIEACETLKYVYKEKIKIEKSEKIATEYYKKACSLGDTKSCNN